MTNAQRFLTMLDDYDGPDVVLTGFTCAQLREIGELAKKAQKCSWWAHAWKPWAIVEHQGKPYPREHFERECKACGTRQSRWMYA